MTAIQRTISSVVFDESLFTYAVLDGTGIPHLRRRLVGENVEHVCLYRGSIEEDLLDASPFLVRLEPSTALTRWVLDGAWNQNWGIFALASADLNSMFSHLRRFLIVEDPHGKKLYFRYYDPSVLRIFLPTCKADELNTMMGPTTRLVFKGAEPGEGSVFTLRTGLHSFTAIQEKSA